MCVGRGGERGDSLRASTVSPLDEAFNDISN